MQFKNLSVAKKIWLLMVLVMGSMLAAGMGMTSYMDTLEENLRGHIQQVDERMRVVVELRGKVETAASFLVAANLAQDADSQSFFENKYAQASQQTQTLLEDTGRRLATDEGRALFQRINEKRAKVNAVAEQISAERRAQGNV
ncbi:MAG: MCP four helix bundle domain-containing protein, partial [Comamonas sp.]|nr:MCP four helix bundle domain-containing protein [Candidatus Comamonas equi]